MVQFFRLSNVVFLINAVLQTIPIISSLKPVTAFGPLTFVLAISMLREGYEDYVKLQIFRKGIKKIGKLIREQRVFSKMVFFNKLSGTPLK